jgi:hypothetical protein
MARVSATEGLRPSLAPFKSGCVPRQGTRGSAARAPLLRSLPDCAICRRPSLSKPKPYPATARGIAACFSHGTPHPSHGRAVPDRTSSFVRIASRVSFMP